MLNLTKEQIDALVAKDKLFDYNNLPELAKRSIFELFEKTFGITTTDIDFFNSVSVIIGKSWNDDATKAKYLDFSNVTVNYNSNREAYQCLVFEIANLVTTYILSQLESIENGIYKERENGNLSKIMLDLGFCREAPTATKDETPVEMVKTRMVKHDLSDLNAKPYLEFLELILALRGE